MTSIREHTPELDLHDLPGRYRVIRELGAGGYGSVYLARDEVLRRDVALKLLTSHSDSASAKSHLLREARALAAVTSPHVVAVLDVLSLDSVNVLVLEAMRGGSVGKKLESSEQIDRRLALHWLAGASAGLAAIHASQLLHCDLKPDNILLDESGRAHIADFGLAQLVNDAGKQTSGGSLGYAAPEIMAGETATVASDLYAFGVVAWELLAGRRAYPEMRTVQYMRAQLIEPLESIVDIAPDLSPDLRHAFASCLEHDPVDRRVSSAQLAMMLAPYLAGPSASSMRNLRGAGVVIVVPVVAMFVLTAIVVWAWVVPEVGPFFAWLQKWHLLRPRYGFRRAYEAIFVGAAAIVAGVFAIVGHIFKLARRAIRSRDARTSLIAPPDWWPTWFPGSGTAAEHRSLPESVHAVRFWTWWVVPVISFSALVATLLALSPEPLLPISLARWLLGIWISSLGITMASTLFLVQKYRNSPVYDALDLIGVVLIRPPIADVAYALPEPADENESSTDHEPTWFDRWKTRWRVSSRIKRTGDVAVAIAFATLIAWLSFVVYQHFTIESVVDSIANFIVRMLDRLS